MGQTISSPKSSPLNKNRQANKENFSECSQTVGARRQYHFCDYVSSPSHLDRHPKEDYERVCDKKLILSDARSPLAMKDRHHLLKRMADDGETLICE